MNLILAVNTTRIAWEEELTFQTTKLSLEEIDTDDSIQGISLGTGKELWEIHLTNSKAMFVEEIKEAKLLEDMKLAT